MRTEGGGRTTPENRDPPVGAVQRGSTATNKEKSVKGQGLGKPQLFDLGERSGRGDKLLPRDGTTEGAAKYRSLSGKGPDSIRS